MCAGRHNGGMANIVPPPYLVIQHRWGSFHSQAWSESVAPAMVLAMATTARIHLLSVAVDRLGRMEVAKRLNVPAVVLQDWIDHQVAIPPAKVLELIDLLDSLDAF